jgi:hypothetical protein
MILEDERLISKVVLSQEQWQYKGHMGLDRFGPL